MSGITGIVHPDGRPADLLDVQNMLHVLNHRGPDGAACARNHQVAFGHCALHTTPESLLESLPLMDDSGTLLLTADVRLDNRSELIHQLGLEQIPQIGDGGLLLKAYERWGLDCAERLLGAFAFAIWDARNQRLFCARDHLGIKPFYYAHQEGRLFAFASEIKALLRLSTLPCRINEKHVAALLVRDMADQTATSYEGIQRLPPAHTLTLTPTALRTRTYWALDPEREIHYASNDAYAEAFYELFEDAVRCRLRSPSPIGCQLSGGLDSSSVTVVARHLLGPDQPIHTFSNIFEDVPSCDEQPYIQEILRHGSYEPHFIRADQRGPLTDWETVLAHEDEAYTGPNHYLVWGLTQAAREAGVRVTLDGFDGDTVVSHGEYHFAELARAQRWEDFRKEADAFVQVGSNVPQRRLLWHFGRPYLKELAENGQWITFAKSAYQVSRLFDMSLPEVWLRYGIRPALPQTVRRILRSLSPLTAHTQNQGKSDRNMLSEDLAARTGTVAPSLPPPTSVREHQWRALTTGGLDYTLELYDRTAAAAAVEMRHPFLDKRLVEFCLALPAEQKLHQGWSRWILRHALHHHLPPAIRDRVDKANMEPNTVRGLVVLDKEQLDAVCTSDLSDVAAFVHTANLQRAYHRLTDHERKYPADVMALWSGLSTALWLRRVWSFDANACPTPRTFL